MQVLSVPLSFMRIADCVAIFQVAADLRIMLRCKWTAILEYVYNLYLCAQVVFIIIFLCLLKRICVFCFAAKTRCSQALNKTKLQGMDTIPMHTIARLK